MKTEFLNKPHLPLLALGVVFTLGGCANLYPELVDYQAEPKQAKAYETTYAMDLSFVPGTVTLEQGERERLDDFLVRLAPQTKDVVFLRTFGKDTGLALSAPRRELIGALLGAHGLSTAFTGQRSDGVAGEDRRLRISLVRYVVTLPGCSDWTKVARGSFDNQPHSNWGCANATNLGLMIAEPRDLIEGRDPGVADGTYAALGAARYNAGETTPLTKQSTSTPEKSGGGS